MKMLRLEEVRKLVRSTNPEAVKPDPNRRLGCRLDSHSNFVHGPMRVEQAVWCWGAEGESEAEDRQLVQMAASEVWEELGFGGMCREFLFVGGHHKLWTPGCWWKVQGGVAVISHV